MDWSKVHWGKIRDWVEDKPVVASRADKQDKVGVRVLNSGPVPWLGEFSEPVVLRFKGMESLFKLTGDI